MADDANRRIVSSARLDLIQEYERANTFRERALAANALWQSLPAHARNEICKKNGHHCGFWLQDQLARSDERTGYAPLTPGARNNLRVLLLKEKETKGRPPRDVRVVWDWLDAGEITPGQLRNMLQRAEALMSQPDAQWDDCLLHARAKTSGESLESVAPTAAPPSVPPVEPPPESRVTPSTVPPAAESVPPPRVKKPVRKPERAKKPKPKPSRAAVEKTLQYQSLRRVIDEAPSPRDLPIPEGVDPSTYREAYREMLENVRVVLDIAGRDFSNAKRRYRTTEITSKVGVLARACRTLRVAVPERGQPADEFNSRRRWLEIVKAYHPDRIGGDHSKQEIFDAANKAFAVIKEYNQRLAQERSEETKQP